MVSIWSILFEMIYCRQEYDRSITYQIRSNAEVGKLNYEPVNDIRSENGTIFIH